jgi:hypothetical protein
MSRILPRAFLRTEVLASLPALRKIEADTC